MLKSIVDRIGQACDSDPINAEMGITVGELRVMCALSDENHEMHAWAVILMMRAVEARRALEPFAAKVSALENHEAEGTIDPTSTAVLVRLEGKDIRRAAEVLADNRDARALARSMFRG